MNKSDRGQGYDKEESKSLIWNAKLVFSDIFDSENFGPVFHMKICAASHFLVVDQINETTSYHTPKGIRIPVTPVKGECPWPLDDGGISLASAYFSKRLPLKYFSRSNFYHQIRKGLV